MSKHCKCENKGDGTCNFCEEKESEEIMEQARIDALKETSEEAAQRFWKSLQPKEEGNMRIAAIYRPTQLDVLNAVIFGIEWQKKNQIKQEAGKLPDDYEDYTERFINLLETLYMVEIKFQDMVTTARRITIAVDQYANYILTGQHSKIHKNEPINIKYELKADKTWFKSKLNPFLRKFKLEIFSTTYDDKVIGYGIRKFLE